MSSSVPQVSVEGKTIDQLEDMLVFFKVRISEENQQLHGMRATLSRLEKHYAQHQTEKPKLHSQLTYLQEQILELQDYVLEYDCEMKVMRKLTRQNNDKVAKSTSQQGGSSRRLLLTRSNNSSKSLMSNESPNHLMAGLTAA